MLLPQDVSMTNNAYFATMAALHCILIKRNERIEDVTIIMTAMCCGYGKMSEDESIRQIEMGILVRNIRSEFLLREIKIRFNVRKIKI